MKKALGIYFTVAVLLLSLYFVLLGAALVKEKTEASWGVAAVGLEDPEKW